jgi:hypothetical protein
VKEEKIEDEVECWQRRSTVVKTLTAVHLDGLTDGKARRT